MRRALAIGLGLLGATLGLASLAAAEVVQRGDLRVSFEGGVTPRKLPRSGLAPVKVEVGGKVDFLAGGQPKQLRKITIAINSNGHLEPRGLPVCEVDDIQPATTENALDACRGSLVGTGSFGAEVLLPEQTPFPSAGKVHAFNGTYEGRPAILVHVYGTDPTPTSFTLPFVVSKRKGAFGTVLTANVPGGGGNFVTELGLSLQRSFIAGGERRSYALAGCPAPKGFPGATFPLARVAYGFAKGPTLSSTLTRNCRARG